MSLGLAAIPSAVCQGRRNLWIQLNSRFLAHRSPLSRISRSFSQCSRTLGRSDDGIAIKKIKRKARQAEFIDSPSAATTAEAGEAGVTSGTKGRVIPLEKNQHQFGHESSHQTIKHGRDKTHRHDQEHPQPKKTSRLRYEDLLPRHGRLHMYRHRLLNYMRQQQQRYQSRKHGQDDHHHNHHHHGRYDNPWVHHWNQWMWRRLDPRQASARSFVYGILATGAGIGMYKANSHRLEQWNNFLDDLSQIKRVFVDGDITPAMRLRSLSAILDTGVESRDTSMVRGITHLPPPQALHASQKHVKMLTPEQVELRLGLHQGSFMFGDPAKGKIKAKSKKTVVQGYCVNQVASNNPIEDDLSRHIVRDGKGKIKRLFFGIYDGHSGWCCSQKVARELAPSVDKELDMINNPGDTNAIIGAIERGFMKLDQRIVHESVDRVLEHPSRPLACSSLLPAVSGSCALLAYINPRGKDLYVACTGDSRAVVGVRESLPNGGHVWRAVPLSTDQTGKNKREVQRLQAEHPGEENTVVMRGRVLGGLEPTRAFGDARYKWSKDIQEKVFQLFPAYRQPYRNYNTPPYVTAKPVVRHHKIQPEDRFLVMATDGLWDKLTSDEVVQLVGDLVDGKTGHGKMVLDREEIKKYRQQRRVAIQSPTSPTNSQENQTQQQDDDDDDLGPSKGSIHQERNFTYRDHANASTHLIRNALGGADDDKIAATLSIPSPLSRVYRDDITVTVVFFGQQDTTLALADAQKSNGCVEIG
ncbi:phosphatase 2C-like domain-containing protein [Mortierella sp. GBAus27b]|nr:hypothetical protein BGX31_002065 [Mortierella sp. GBA43]KAI8353772.1 phosphatase 2C-like domain-containing protein [Mortierella sp. GBAus27b]